MDISNVESAYLRALAKFETWKQKTEVNYNMPAMKTTVGIAEQKLQNLPTEVQSISRAQHPAEWKALDERTKKVNKAEVKYVS